MPFGHSFFCWLTFYAQLFSLFSLTLSFSPSLTYSQCENFSSLLISESTTNCLWTKKKCNNATCKQLLCLAILVRFFFSPIRWASVLFHYCSVVRSLAVTTTECTKICEMIENGLQHRICHAGTNNIILIDIGLEGSAKTCIKHSKRHAKQPTTEKCVQIMISILIWISIIHGFRNATRNWSLSKWRVLAVIIVDY